MFKFKQLGITVLVVFLTLGCQKKEASQDFDEEVCYWVCSRDQNEFTCTFDELAEFQQKDGNYSRPFNCPSCGKNDKVTRLPDSDAVKERFKNKVNK